MIFLYVQGLRGPQPEKWSELLTDMKNNPKPHLQPRHDLLPWEEDLSLAELTTIYPPPIMVME